jgi:hypothetical protein
VFSVGLVIRCFTQEDLSARHYGSPFRPSEIFIMFRGAVARSPKWRQAGETRDVRAALQRIVGCLTVDETAAEPTDFPATPNSSSQAAARSCSFTGGLLAYGHTVQTR